MAIKTVQATVNGQTVTLTLNSSTGKYEAQLTAPNDSSYNLPGGYYPVSVKAVDTAGNATTVDSTHSTLGSSLRLYVKEQVKPVITILAPSSGAYVTTGTPEIRFKALDNTVQTSGYSGINKGSCVIVTDSSSYGEGIIWTETDGGFIGSYTPTTALSDGEHTVKIIISDHDGNTSEYASCTFTVDTVAPSLTVTAPAEGFETNQSELAVSGATDDVTSKPVTVAVKLNGTDCGEVTVNSDGTFSKEITLTTQGENVIVVTATDKAGKVTTVTRRIIFNTTAPVIKSVTISPNPVYAGKIYTIEVEIE